MTYEQWEMSVPTEIRSDSLWRVRAYRLALFLAHLAWIDTEKLFGQNRTSHHADQLLRAASKISSSISEGYSRDTAKARATYYDYATGSPRETRDWYFKLRRVLADEVVAHRMDLTTQLIKLSLKMIATERRSNRRVSAS